MRHIISNYFIESDRNRFLNLLELAKDSKYPGERENALAAATRIAQKYDMPLEAATHWQPSEDTRQTAPRVTRSYNKKSKNIDYSNLAKTQKNADAEKARWQAAVDRAKARGLDREENARKAQQDAAAERKGNSKSRRNPETHAKILLKETSLSFEEISEITGLDVYKIITMKLKSRSAA